MSQPNQNTKPDYSWTHNVPYMEHKKSLMIVRIIGALIFIAGMSLCLTMLGLTVYGFVTGKADVSAIQGMFGTLSGLITTAIAYICPSPFQQQQAPRRTSDITPSGTPSDPVSTSEVKASDTNADSASAVAPANTTQGDNAAPTGE